MVKWFFPSQALQQQHLYSSGKIMVEQKVVTGGHSALTLRLGPPLDPLSDCLPFSHKVVSSERKNSLSALNWGSIHLGFHYPRKKIPPSKRPLLLIKVAHKTQGIWDQRVSRTHLGMKVSTRHFWNEGTVRISSPTSRGLCFHVWLQLTYTIRRGRSSQF